MEKKMTAHELYEYRIKLIRDAHAFQKPDRTPIKGNMYTWMFTDAGYTFGEATRDYSIIEQCCIRFVEKYKVDGMNQFAHTGYRNATLVLDSLGSSNVYTDDNDAGVNAVMEDVMLPDEYDEILEDYDRFLWTKALPRLFPNVKNMPLEDFANASQSVKEFNEAKMHTAKLLCEEYGTVEETVMCYQPPMDALMTYFRGIKGLAMDLRRRPDKIQEFCDQRTEIILPPILKAMDAIEGPNMEQPYDVSMSLLAHTILNRKQWERFYVPYLKRVLDYCEVHNKQAFLFCEGNWEIGGDFFNEYKKGTCNITTEVGDPYALRKQYPNVCQYGGLDVSVLGVGTKQECIDMAKKAIDELGSEGGLVLQPNKMVSYANDMKAENFEAVCDFVIQYRP